MNVLCNCHTIVDYVIRSKNDGRRRLRHFQGEERLRLAIYLIKSQPKTHNLNVRQLLQRSELVFLICHFDETDEK